MEGLQENLETKPVASSIFPIPYSLKLHLVTFAVPYPADYGGAIDVFYKIKALHEQGVKITLHCFVYADRKPHIELLKYCSEVFYYHRTTNVLQQLTLAPFIVATRKNEGLLKNLNADDAPILFEGLHTCAYVNHKSLKHRKKFVRMHNIEWEYYRNLFRTEKNIFKQVYFYFESLRLKVFEKKLVDAVEKIFFISPDDEKKFLERFKSKFLKKQSEIIFPFHNSVLQFSNFVNEKKYFFFTGNLSVAENENAVRAIIKNIFSSAFINKFPFYVVGKSPNDFFKKFLKETASVHLIENPDDDYLSALSQQAAAHILYVDYSAGVKLKLIRALAENRNVFVSASLMPDDAWKNYCHVYYSWSDLQGQLNRFDFSFSDENIEEKRKILFETDLNNASNAQKIINFIF